MKYFVDMLDPPTPAQADTLDGLGWKYCAVYVGGPRAAAHADWQIRDGIRYPVGDVMGFFDGFLPIYVGRNAPWDGPSALTYAQGLDDGDDANRLTGACGFDSPSILCLDMEYGTFQSNPNGGHEYIRGWVERVNGAGHPACLYSDIYTLSQIELGTMIDFKWGAAWVGGHSFSSAPLGQFDPRTPPPWDAWQFGSGTIAGVQVDCNSATDDFPFAQYALA